jgi:AcrR family transcriptional regulator
MNEDDWPQGDARESEKRREELIASVLALAGEGGFRELTMQAVLERARSDDRAFHAHFETLADAFGAAYADVCEEVGEELLEAGRLADDWRAGFRAALEAFLRWIARKPGAARILLIEYRVAGGRSAEIHEAFCERLAKAIDTAREQRELQLNPPSLAPSFILGAIEFETADRIMRGEAASVIELAPTLAYFGVLMYFGHAMAREELG